MCVSLSPAPSLGSSSHSVGLGTSQLMAAAHRKQESSVGLTSSLANYINPKLMDHVSGWLVDPAEIQVFFNLINSIMIVQRRRRHIFGPHMHVCHCNHENLGRHLSLIQK